MKPMTRLACIVAAAMLAVTATATTALAQAFPARPIHIIVPFPPGGPNDFFARVLGKQLDKTTGQTTVIENRAGAAGTLGVGIVAHAQPDGYTLVLTSMGSLTVFPVIAKTPPYNPAKDLAPITIVAKVPEVLVAIPKLGFHSMGDLITYAKSHPGKINFASAGSGGLPHLAGELLKREAGIDIVHIPYAGAAPAVADLLAGNDVQQATGVALLRRGVVSAADQVAGDGVGLHLVGVRVGERVVRVTHGATDRVSEYAEPAAAHPAHRDVAAHPVVLVGAECGASEQHVVAVHAPAAAGLHDAAVDPVAVEDHRQRRRGKHVALDVIVSGRRAAGGR